MIKKWSGILKRPTAMLLAVLMTLSMVPLYSAAPAESEMPAGASDSSNLISNGGFDADLTGWKSVPVDGYTGSHFAHCEGNLPTHYRKRT